MQKRGISHEVFMTVYLTVVFILVVIVTILMWNLGMFENMSRGSAIGIALFYLMVGIRLTKSIIEMRL